jgi:hypothetical protein
MPQPLEFHQSFELAGKSQISAAFGSEHALYHLPNAIFIQRSIDPAHPK